MMYFFKKYKIKIILIVIIITFTIFATYFSSPRNSYSNSFVSKVISNQSYEVTDVIDGDTFDIKVNNEIIRIRMLGIDTPETVDPRKSIGCYGKEASDKTKEMLKGHSVTLEIDKTQYSTDKYGRFLAYVNTDNGVFMNEYLLKNGFAREYTYGKAYSKQKEYKKIEKEAKNNKVGLWNECLNK